MKRAYRVSSHPVMWYVLCLFSLAFLLGGIAVLYIENSSYFSFQYNHYVLLSLLVIVTNSLLLVALYRRPGNFHVRTWFAVTLVGMILLSLGELFMRLSTTPVQALFWGQMLPIGLASISLGYYMFIYFFTGSKYTIQEALLPALLIGVAALFRVFIHTSGEIELVSSNSGPWGYGYPVSTEFLFLALWASLVVVLANIKLYAYFKTDINTIQKEQARIILFGSTATLLLALGLDIVPQILDMNIVPLGVLVQTVMPLSVIYAMYKYDMFSIDFSLLAENVFDTLSEGIVITDSEFNIKMINMYALSMSNQKKEPLYNQPISTFFEHERFKTLHATIYKQLKLSKVAKISDVNIVNKLGGLIPVSISVTKLEGSVDAYLFTFLDISELKNSYNYLEDRNVELENMNQKSAGQQKAMLNLLEDARDMSEQLKIEKESVERKVEARTVEVRAERARLEASINSLDRGFIILDKDKQILSANKAFQVLIEEYDQSSESGITALSALLSDTFDLGLSIDKAIESGQSITKDDLKMGSKVLKIFIAPITDRLSKGQQLGVVILIDDVTEAKAIQRSRDEFFSIASHELRTPLTAIKGNSSMILDFYKEQLKDPSLKEMVSDIHDSSNRLITIVNEFLDMSRLEQGKISFVIADIDVNDLAKDVVQEFKAGDIRSDLYIKIKADKHVPLVKVDSDRLKQVMINLIGNGLKFTDKGGITIGLKKVDNSLLIEVTDTGKGIPEESSQLLFRKFQQASNNILTRDSTRSTGLGLYISKLIIEGMGGEIYLESSTVNKGSTFVIRLPIASKNQIKIP